MGNHEYCINCGEDSYHYGEPCDPKVYKAHQVELARNKELALKATGKLMRYLEKAGIKYHINQYGNAEINKWDI